MNTVLSDEQIKMVCSYDNVKYIDDYERDIAKSQDAHTRLELAKAVRDIENPLIGVEGSWAKCYQDGFEAMRKAVLKVIEGK